MAIEIRKLTSGDAAAIAEIQRLSPETAAWAPDDFTCDVALEAGEIAGFLVTRDTAADESEILNVAVHPRYRRRGIGKRLIENALSRRRVRWFLEVRESNWGAINLYTALGFEETGRRQDYYTHPVEAAIVMSFFS